LKFGPACGALTMNYASPPPERYPIIVTCIVEHMDDSNMPEIRAIRDHVNASNAFFITRVYNPEGYSDDCNYVKSLPAFHVHIKRGYATTFYLNTRPLQVVNESIQEYLLLQKGAARNIYLPSLYKGLVQAMKRAVHRIKTATHGKGI
jgi:hypothetical protein